VARTLGISIPESEMITKLIPWGPKIALAKAIEGEPKLRELKEEQRFSELFTLAFKLEGLNRHSSLHASGVVIGNSALHNLVPLFKDSKTDAIATQYDMSHLEKCGLVKMDFLGLKTLDVIKRTEELIRQKGGEYVGFNVETINEDDEATFKMLGEGLSFEVFQFESDGMQDVLKRAKPGKIEDLIALNALYRPGPMANIPRFIDSKHGRQAIAYPDPSLEEVLKETYGVIVYQEQVLQVVRIIAGFTLGHADELRRAMGKKNMEKMVREKEKFIAGAREKGFSEKKADEIFELLVPFAGYGFNKSHAAGYALLAYRTAYLKANFPVEFMAANLSNEIHSADKDKLSQCINEARKIGITVEPPDINRSFKLFTINEGRINYGLLGIKGLGDISADEIVNCRREGPYRDFLDFLERVDIKAVGKSVIEKLIQTGAFDQLGKARGTLLGNLERAIEYIQSIKDDKKFGQGSLFGDAGEKEYPDFEFEDFPESDRADKLKIEKELIGFYFSGHPMDEYREMWLRMVKVNLASSETLAGGGQILIGLIRNIKPITTSKGEKMAFASLEDYNGEIELTFFPSSWEKCRALVENDKVAILKGKIEYQQNKDKRSFTVDECLKTDEADKAVKEEETKNRKWDKYRNVRKYATDLKLRFLDLEATSQAENGSYTVLGVLKSLKTLNDKKGNEMAFGTLEDSRGEIELVFFARAWLSCKAFVAVNEIIALKGTIDRSMDKNPGKPGFYVSSIQDINKFIRAAEKKAAELPKSDTAKESQQSDITNAFREIHIRLAANAAFDEAALYSLKNCLEENPGSCQVYIHIPAASAESETVIRTAGRIDPVSIGVLTNCTAAATVWGV
jgi:DNA polymerase-3 subunit alpha